MFSTPTVTDGGLETDLIFHRGMTLAEFAAFPLLDDAARSEVLADYYAGYADIARRAGAALVLEGATWRANPDWGARVGYDRAALDRVNRASIEFLAGLRDRFAVDDTTVGGSIGPRGDGYRPGDAGRSRRGRRVPPSAARGLRRGRRRPRDGLHAHRSGRGDRHRPRRAVRRRPGRHLLHRRDRRPVAGRHDARRRGAHRRRGRGARPLRRELRASRPTSRRRWTSPVTGASGSGCCGRTPRGAAMPSWTTPPNSTTATPPTWPGRRRELDLPARHGRRRMLRHRRAARRRAVGR